tara:strand:+ start:353 stop:547 length:195 start_codon:yes stop_codon:yes gene_type:complete
MAVKRKYKKQETGLYLPVKRTKKKKRNWLERKLDEYNHTMELVRTILPIIIIVIQVIILVEIFK